MRYLSGLAAVVASLVIQSASIAETLRYSIVEIPTLGGLNAFPASHNALNERGEVAGTSDVTFASNGNAPIYHAFVYSRGVIRDLGAGAGVNSIAKAINAKGQAVFESRGTNYDSFRSYLYSNGSVVEVGDLGGHISAPNSINDNGDVVGQAYVPGGGSYWRAWLYTNGSSTNIPANFVTEAVAIGVSNSKLVAGTALVMDFANNDFGMRAFVSSSGGPMKFLGCIEENPCAYPHASFAEVMNSSGQVAGKANTPNGEIHAFLWSKGAMIDLEALPNSIRKQSEAYAISSNGYVTGISYVNGLLGGGNYSRAFLAGRGKIIDLGLIAGASQSVGRAVNNRGEVVGECVFEAPASPLPYAAFLYSEGVMYDLNKLVIPQKSLIGRVNLISAYAVTDSGYILALGFNSATGGMQTYLLKRLQ